MNKRSAGGRKARRKGGRVERELVKFLKELGCASARRTAQLNGKSEYSESDVVASKELPHFHLESKGTEKENLSAKLLTDWRNQMLRDCKEACVPVLFHKANNRPWVVLLTEWAVGELHLTGQGFMIGEATITPSFCTIVSDSNGTPYDFQLILLPDNTRMYAFPAEVVVNQMLAYEDNIRDRGPGERGGLETIPSC